MYVLMLMVILDDKDLDVVIAIYSLLQYVNNNSNISGSLFKYCRDEPALDNDGSIVNLIYN